MNSQGGSHRVIGYTRVSTSEQGDSGLGLEAQESAIRIECARRGWHLDRIATDVASGASAKGRTSYSEALSELDDHGGVLIVAKLDRLSRSLGDFAGLMDRAARRRWAVVVLDVATDTTTPQGEMIANIMATFAQYERKLIGQRTRDALAAKKAQGARLGRPVSLPDSTRRRIAGLHGEGLSLRAIAEVLNTDAVATAHGGVRWHASTVRSTLRSLELDAESVALAT